MKKIILGVLLVLLFSIGAACASDANDTIGTEDQQILADTPRTFTELEIDINASDDTFDVQDNYTFNSESDKGYVEISKSDFTINGNNHVIDGNRQSGIFNITGNNVTISNLIFKNGKSETGGIIDSTGEVTLRNVTFITNNMTFLSDHITYKGGAIANHGGKINCYDSRFIDNHAESGSAIFIQNGELNVKNTNFTSSISNKYGQIWVKESSATIDGANFINISAIYSPAISFEKCEDIVITNSRFINLSAEMSAGAFGLKNKGNLYMRDCKFINTKSSKNAGAIMMDYEVEDCNVTILDCSFVNSSAMIGGAYVQLWGKLFMNNSDFTNCRASYNGGAVYLSFAKSSIYNCTFNSNAASLSEDYTAYGGAIYCDIGTMELANSSFINNSAYLGNAVYACDSKYNITNCTFANNTNAIYTDFDGDEVNLDGNDYGDDSVITNQTYSYQTFIDSVAQEWISLDNIINVETLPSRFDLRDWGWVTPVKHQGHLGACWTFAMMNVVESAMLKKYGVSLNLSESNLIHTMLKYSHYGFKVAEEGGNNVMSISYVVDWFGPVFEENDPYDEVGKLSQFLPSSDIIHVQDAILIPNDEPGTSKMKEAILKYGALVAGYHVNPYKPYYNPKTFANYVNESLTSNHEISVVGWDDDFSADNFLIKPDGDGAWIVKNSWGTGWGEEGFFYISYYDKSFLGDSNVFSHAAAVILENDVAYTKNYQHDFSWSGQFVDYTEQYGVNGTMIYANQFEAAADDLIAGVGTYFNQSGVNYTVEIYVNEELKLIQNGVSPFYGFHTIKLNEYVSVKKGDVFKAVITSNAVPVVNLKYSRTHYGENLSFLYYGGKWNDMYKDECIACLKVFTVNDTSKIINNRDISVDYGGESYFSVNVVTGDGHAVVGAAVKFTINGKTTTAFSDDDGIAKVRITDVPGTYEVTTECNGQACSNKVTVNLNANTCKITQNKNIKVDYDGGKYFSVKIVSQDGKVAASGVSVKFTINGKSTTVKTDKNGIAKIKITDVPKKYTMTTTYNGKSVKNTVTVNQVLKAKKVTLKKTAKKLTLKATLKINGKLQKGKQITFKFNGKTYKVKTNKKGVAQKTLNKKIIKKLKKGKKYTVKVTYKKDTIKTTVKVK